MIVVRIELRSALTGDVRELGRMFIANDDTGDDNVGNYDVTVNTDDGGLAGRVRHLGFVRGYARRTSNIWLLVQQALGSVFPEKG